MTACSTNECGVGGWGGPLPGDPDNNSILSATPAFGGIDVSWTHPATNPGAVAHVILYRGVFSDFNSAIVIATVGGNFFYDKSTSPQLIQYYYWIKIVSVNGTVGALIGPASAIAKPPIASVIEGLTAKIDAGLLAQSLKTEIDKITLNAQAITEERVERIGANNAYTSLLLQVQAGVEDAYGAITQEIVARQDGESVLAAAINTTQSVLGNDIASAQTTLQTNITAVNGKVTEIGALYTAKVTVNGLIGGFGIYNDGTTVEAGFDVDTFWVGRTQGNKRKPFIISGGVTYIDEAAIEKLTFNKLRDQSGSFIVENGKVKADYLNVIQITGGAYTAYAWPAAGQQGFYLGPGGLLMGNYNNGSWFQVEQNGNVNASQFNITNGNASFSGNLAAASGTFSGSLTAQVINTSNIIGAAVTSGYSASSAGDTTTVTVVVPSGATSVLVVAYLGAPYTYTNGIGKDAYVVTGIPFGTLYLDDVAITSQSGTLVWSFDSAAQGTYVLRITRNYVSATMNMTVLVNKR